MSSIDNRLKDLALGGKGLIQAIKKNIRKE